jgi:hypothetical protein
LDEDSLQQPRGLLVPVANPEGVPPLLTIAFAASAPDDPPTRVLALVNRSSREISREAPPPTPALKTAIEYAASRGASILPLSVWSDRPGADIIAAARTANVRWVLLGYHRTATGHDTMGGVVRDVFASALGTSVHIGVFIHGTDLPLERIHVTVHSGPDGRAALDLALRVARTSSAKVRALLVSNTLAQPEDDLVELIRTARHQMGRRFHSDVLSERSLDQLLSQSPGRLLIVGKKLADEIHLPLDEAPEGERCVIVVQGADEKFRDADHRSRERHA